MTMIKKEDFKFVGVKLLQKRGKSIIRYKERVKITSKDGDTEEIWISMTAKPPRFPHDDLKRAILDLVPIYAKQCKRDVNEVRLTYFEIEEAKEDIVYHLQGLIREPSGYYNSYCPHKLDESSLTYYDENDEIPILADVIVKETFLWLINKKYDNSGILNLWGDDEDTYEGDEGEGEGENAGDSDDNLEIAPKKDQD